MRDIETRPATYPFNAIAHDSPTRVRFETPNRDVPVAKVPSNQNRTGAGIPLRMPPYTLFYLSSMGPLTRRYLRVMLLIRCESCTSNFHQN